MQWAIVIAAFLASGVEVVEVFTLVLVLIITHNSGRAPERKKSEEGAT